MIKSRAGSFINPSFSTIAHPVISPLNTADFAPKIPALSPAANTPATDVSP